MKTNLLNQLLMVGLLSIFGFSFQGCKDDDINWDLEAKKELYNVMHDYYYWYDQVPTLNINNYETPVELMEALMVNPPDKWSYVTTKQEYDAYSAGKYYGFGFSSIFDLDEKLWIGYVFRSSPLAPMGIGRGWRIATIDGVTPTKDNYTQLLGDNLPGISKTLGFISPTGNSVSYTFTKIEIEMNTILFDSVYTFNSKKIGYLVLKGFIPPTKTELNTCFAKFKSENVEELIVDLRYNGGGSIDVSNHFASLIGGSTTSGKPYTIFSYNNRYTYENQTINYLSLPNSLTLNQTLFITTNGTASASELVINGLKPYMNVALIGSRTHGKPVGMPVLRYNEFDWVFLPICISLRNADNVGDYFDGLAVNVEATDDYTLKFGDVNEASFAAALNYLGVSPVKSAEKKIVKGSTLVTGKGLYEEIGAW